MVPQTHFQKGDTMSKTKTKPSTPALIMYGIIGVSAVTSALCFFLYYRGLSPYTATLWTGIVFLTIYYHLQMRLLMGNVTKLFKLNPESAFFREKKFEKKLYKFLKVKKWKGKALTYNPELYDVKSRTPAEIAYATAKSETDHWINILIALSTAVFGIIWGNLWIFLVTVLPIALFDGQFIVIQRYNRPRLLRLVKRKMPKREAK